MKIMKKIVNFILGIVIIFLVEYFSIWVLKLLKIQFPHAVFGIIILFFLLQTKIIKEEWVEEFSNFITKYMILFFIPIFVGVISYKNLILDNLLIILTTIFLTTTLIIVFTGLVVENIIKYKRLQKIRRKTK